MTRYVVSPEAAREIITRTENHASSAASAAQRLAGAIDSAAGAFGPSRVGPTVAEWLQSASFMVSTQLTRSDNITGAGFKVVAVLEAADEEMARQAYSRVGELLGEADTFVDKGMSR